MADIIQQDMTRSMRAELNSCVERNRVGGDIGLPATREDMARLYKNKEYAKTPSPCRAPKRSSRRYRMNHDLPDNAIPTEPC
jgi:hypothetical protein